jgi:nucleoside-diphosphate-sugar epimerase
VYGPRENETHAIIAFVAKALMRQDPFEIWGSGQQDRNFTYIDDMVTGMMLAAQKVSDCSAINPGTDEIVKIIDAVRIVCESLGTGLAIERSRRVFARAASVERQEQLLGWRPKVSFRAGIEKTIDWFANSHAIDALKTKFEARLFERNV